MAFQQPSKSQRIEPRLKVTVLAYEPDQNCARSLTILDNFWTTESLATL